MVKVVLRSTVAAVALMVGFSHIAAAAPITSNWTPGNAGNWSGGPGGDAVNWSHSSAPATTTFPNNTGGDTFTVNIDNGGGPASSVNLNVNATIDTLNVSSGDTLNINNNSILRFAPNATVTNNGSINANSGNNPTGLIFTGASALTGSGTVTLGNNAANLLRNDAAADVLTHGASHTIQGAGNILQGIGGLNNAGTILANQGAPLTIDPGALPVNNTGTLGAAAGGTLLLGSGVFNNAGGSIEADGPGSNVSLTTSSVTVNGGSFTTTNGAQIRSSVNGPQLNGVTFTNGTDVVLNNNHDLRILNGLTNNGTISMNSGNNATDVQFIGSQTLTGTGQVVMGQNAANRVIVNVDATQLTLDTDQTIRGAGQVLANSGGFINNGTIRQEGAQALTLDPGSADVGGGANFINNGVLETTGSGGLTLNGGVYDNNTVIESTGSGDIRLANSVVTINGGDLKTSAGTGVIRSAVTGARLDGVRITTGSQVVLSNDHDLRILNGLTNNGTITMNSGNNLTDLQFIGSQTLTGTGEVVMGQNLANRVIVNADSTQLTLDSDQTIRGAGQVLANAGGFINNGTIRQEGIRALVLDPGNADVGGGANFINNAVLESTGSGGLTLNAGIYDNNTVIESTGSGDIRFATSGVTIVGGDLKTSAGTGVIRSAVTGAQLDGVRITTGSQVVLNNNHDLRLLNGLTNNGTITMNSGNNLTDLQFVGSQTLTGTGEVVMGQNLANRVIVNAGSTQLTLDTDQTIRGAGQVLANAGGFINNGTIRQEGIRALVLDPGNANVGGGANFINNAVLESTGSGGLTLNGGIYDNNTVIESTGSGDIRLASSAVRIVGGDLKTSAGTGVIRSVVTGAQLEGVRITTGSRVVLNNNEDLRIFNGLTNNGEISLNSGNNQTDIQFAGSQTLSGTGEIVMGSNLANRVIVQANANTITQAANHTIRGAGRILQNAGGFINQGSVVADDASRQLLIDAGTNFRNEGTMRAEAVPGFSIAGGTRFTQAGGLFDIDGGSRAQIHSGDFVQTGGHTQVDGLLNVNAIGSDVQIQGGTFGGTGLVDFDGTGVHALNNTGGMITAGASPGTLTIQDGNFVQGAGGTFEFELDGFVAGVGHDLLNIVNGDADLGGDLSIVADQLFASTLSIGDQFEVVRLDQLGTFIDGDLVNGADLFDNIIINLGGLNFTQVFIGNSLFIEVTQANVQPPGVDPIPEPESMILMMLGLTAILWMRRRRVTIH